MWPEAEYSKGLGVPIGERGRHPCPVNDGL